MYDGDDLPELKYLSYCVMCPYVRFAKYYKMENGTDYRTLVKAYAIRFDVLVNGNVSLSSVFIKNHSLTLDISTYLDSQFSDFLHLISSYLVLNINVQSHCAFSHSRSFL